MSRNWNFKDAKKISEFSLEFPYVIQSKHGKNLSRTLSTEKAKIS